MKDVADAKSTEAEVRKLQRLLSATASAAKMGGWEIDLASQGLTWTDEVYRIYELEKDFRPTVEGTIAFYAPESLPIVSEAVRRASEDGWPFDLELTLITARKNRRLVQATGEAMLENGKIVGVSGTFRDITDQRKMQEDLRSSEGFLRAIIDNSPSLIFALDRDGRFLLLNRRLEKLIGASPGGAVGKTRKMFLPPKIADEHLKNDQKVFRLGRVHVAEEPSLEPDGMHTYQTVKFPILHPDGTVFAVGGISTDITLRKRADILMEARVQLAETSEKKTLDELLQAGLDTAERLTGSNIGFFHFLDTDQETLTLQTWSTNTLKKMCTAEGKGSHYAVSQAGVWAECVATKAAVIHNDYASLAHKKGLPPGHAGIVRELVVPLLCDGLVVGIMGVGNKPTDYNPADVEAIETLGMMIIDRAISKRTEMALADSETKLRAVFDSVRDGIFAANVADKKLIMANRAACSMFGYSEEEFRNLTAQDLHPIEAWPSVHVLMEKQIRGEIQTIENIPVKRKNGSVFLVDINTAPTVIGGASVLLGSFRDVTERREMQMKLAQSDRLASVGMLAAGVAHEINNPLSYVLYNLQTLFKEFSEKGDAGEMLKEALAGAERIHEISRGLGTFSRVEREEASPIDVRQAIDHAVQMAGNEIRFRARLVRDFEEVSLVLASEGKMAQVFLNLLINAAHAIDEGNVELNEIRIRVWSDRDRVNVEVTDTGRGIPVENQARIFEPFFTTKEAGLGSGLGLSICKNIVTGFGGKISFESSLGKTRFHVELPALPSDFVFAPKERVLPVEELERAHSRILVVDDEPGIRKALARILSTDHEVVSASSGEEGRDILERDEAFDLLLLDLMMPKMSGMELHEWLATRKPNLADKVMFLTGGVFTPKARDYLTKIPNPCLEKPFDPSELREKVRHFVLAVSKHR